MIPQTDLETAVRKTVQLYNRIKGAQAVAKATQISPELVTISFSGPFCYECGDVQKYVDDFARDFRVFIDYLELSAGKARETTPHSVEVNYLVKPR